MKKTILMASLASLLSFGASAEIRWSGFGTVAGGITTGTDEVQSGFDDELDFKAGSFFAIQGTSDLGEGLSATIQIMAKGEDDWDPDFAWAYLAYEVTDDWRLLFGRQVLPFYMYSDYINVSYAYHWIAPPSQFYVAPFSAFDGVASIYTKYFGDSSVTAHLFTGLNNNSDDDSEFKITGGAFSYNYDWLTLQFNYVQMDSTVPISELDSLEQSWRQVGFPQVADDLVLDDDDQVIASFGARVNYGDWLLLAEYKESDLGKTILAHSDTWYVSAGYTIDSVMLHATIGEKDAIVDYSLLDDVPVGADPGLDALIGGTRGLIATLDADVPFYILGARWDFHDSMALKVEYSHHDLDITDTKSNLFQVALVSVF